LEYNPNSRPEGIIVMAKTSSSPLNRLGRRAETAFFGRNNELGTLVDSLSPQGPLVSFIHGSAGIGKTTLMAQFARLGEAKGASVQMMDCRLIEPTSREFLAEWSRLSGASFKNESEAAHSLAQSGKMFVLCLDHYDSFLLLDTWLRQELMPLMPDNFHLMMAGRRPPVPRWLTSPSWHGLFRVMALAPLDKAAARELLLQANIPAEQC
jgi:hypothetical protein